MATVHDLLVAYQAASADLDAKKAASTAARQAATDADTAVTAAEAAAKDAADAVKDGLAAVGATYIANPDGTPQVEPDGTIQTFEPDATSNGWHVTHVKPSTIAVPDPNPAAPSQPVLPAPDPTNQQP